MPDHAVDQARVGSILSRARKRTDANDFPQLAELRLLAGLPEKRKQGRGRGKWLTQQEMSLLMGFIEERADWYKRLELGLISQPADEDLRMVSELLRLTPREWEQLHIGLFGHRTLKTHNPDAGLKVASVWSHVIHSSTIAAYISNRAWDVLDFNEEADELWGGMPANILREMLDLSPVRHERSTQPCEKRPWGDRALWQLEVLGLPAQPPSRCHMPDWHVWCLSATSNLRVALADYPRDRTLRQIEAEVRHDAELLAMYEGPVDGNTEPEDRDVHPDGTRRLMYHPIKDEIVIMEAAVSEPGGAPGARVVWMHTTPLEQATSSCSCDCAIYHIHER
ncbi:hypothetical protein ABR737_00740 [Streptomyces sp. Edi2]|uniref:hypothetical protein n=1 Tax=Streptomyces sp. Edi2 TaxID=3162528 RepID=UPI00330692D6